MIHVKASAQAGRAGAHRFLIETGPRYSFDQVLAASASE